MQRNRAPGLDHHAGMVAAQLPDGEIGHSLGFYLGFVCVGSQKGFRVGMPDGSGDITLGRLIPTNTTVWAFEGQDRFVWYTNGNFDPDGPNTGLGRMDLTTFTAPLTPAYANDLHDHSAGVTFAVVTFNNRRVFSVTGVGVFIESDELEERGWIETGRFTWGTMDNKIGLYAQLRYLPLQGAVSCLVAFDDSDYIPISSVSVQGDTGAKNLSLQQNVFATARMKVELTRSAQDITKGPTITRIEFRVFPNAGRASEWNLPLVLWDSVEWDAQVENRDPRADLDRLINMVETGRVVTYQEGSRGWQVNVTDYKWEPDKPSGVDGWQGTCTVRLREVR